MVAPSVWRFGTRFVNFYVVEADNALIVVDSGLTGYVSDLDAALHAISAERSDVTAVVLTHADGDHIGMAAAFCRAGARVLVHEADETQLRKPAPKGGDARLTGMVRYLYRPGFARFVSHMVVNGWSRAQAPEQLEVFGDGEVLDVPGRLRVFHTPGHTHGHCALLLEDREVLFTGDALSTWDPYTGARGPLLMSGPAHFDATQARLSHARLLTFGARVLLPGHGDPWQRQAPDA
jgi:glyoxylase-like metal-dependent hydrolase (beta-lactamase superfamily II)